MIFWVIELFCVWTRIIFDWCNKITTDFLSNVLEVDSIACLKLLSKKQVIKNFLEIQNSKHKQAILSDVARELQTPEKRDHTGRKKSQSEGNSPLSSTSDSDMEEG